MQQSEHTVQVTQRESDHQRWADDGGYIPEPESGAVRSVSRYPWRVVAVATALGFALGWLTASSGSRC